MIKRLNPPKIHPIWFSMFLLVVIVLMRTVGGNAEPEKMVVNILPELAGAYGRVVTRSNVPVLLPTKIPDSVGEELWFSPGLIDDPDKYEFYVGLTEDCEGTGVCTRASFGGELVGEDTPSLEEMYGYLAEPPARPMPRSEEPMGSVELIDGITGQFIPWQAPAQCSEAKIVWTTESGDKNYRYYVGIRCGSMDDLIAFANSVLGNIPDTDGET